MCALNATPLFGNELEWVSVTVACPTCGESQVEYQIRTLIDMRPDYVCPMCDQPTGQTTIVEVQ